MLHLLLSVILDLTFFCRGGDSQQLRHVPSRLDKCVGSRKSHDRTSFLSKEDKAKKVAQSSTLDQVSCHCSLAHKILRIKALEAQNISELFLKTMH